MMRKFVAFVVLLFFYSTTTQEIPNPFVSLECNNNNLKVTFNKTVLTNRNRYYELQFNGQEEISGCSGINGSQLEYINGDLIHIEANYSHCGISKIETNNTFIFTQIVKAVYGKNPNHPLIYREYHDSFTVRCLLNRNVTINLDKPINVRFLETAISEANSTAEWNIQLNRMTSNYSSVDPSGVVALGETLYFQVELISSRADIQMHPQDCYATKVDGSARFNMITDRCVDPGSPTVVIPAIGSSKFARWHVEAFKYFDSDQLYIHCDVLICKENSSDPNCNRCFSRKRRYVPTISEFTASNEDPPVHLLVRSQLITMVAREGKGTGIDVDKKADVDAQSSGQFGTTAIIIIAVLAVVVLTVAVVAIKQFFFQSPNVPVLPMKTDY